MRQQNRPPYSASIDLAIAEARLRRSNTRQHQAVVQRFDRLVVIPASKDRALRPLWTTRDDCRHPGVKRNNTKLSIEDIPVIAQLRQEGMKVWEVAAKFDVHPNTITKAMRGQSWGGIPRIPHGRPKR